jgi:NAD(P)-dependent dehydrogenase (short-subunit alcohol dehydrogenase family)/plasmid stabilization system protein ParE
VKPHIVRPAAAADIERGYDWYERERTGLGEEFLAEAFTSVQAALDRPETFPVLFRHTRRVLVRRFPYALFFRVTDEFIVFVACFHVRRSPRILATAPVKADPTYAAPSGDEPWPGFSSPERAEGSATTRRCCWRAGHEVIATMRNPGGCDLAEVAREAALPLTVLALDVDDDAAVARVFAHVGDAVDVLVNNAGILSITAVEDESVEQCRRIMEANFFGAVRCTKQGLPAMRERRSGHIINITSIAGRIACYSESAYCASKCALEAFSESLAQEVKGFGIRVTLLEPGIIDSDIATTSLPPYDPRTSYPHGRRLRAFFHHPNRGTAPPTVVGEMLRYLVEHDDPRLRLPVGPDARSFLGWRASLSDEDWVGLGGRDDADYFQRVFLDTGLDLRSS